MDRMTFLQKRNINLDLAVEAHALLQGEADIEVEGVIMDQEEFADGTITSITIKNAAGEKAMGRPKGNYITFELPELRDADLIRDYQETTSALAHKLHDVVHPEKNKVFLVVGLGNWHATPDALGPKVVDRTLVTRHLFHYIPEELTGKMRNVAAIAPGVLGLTGLETAEVLKGLIEHVQPDCLIAVDALAAGSLEHIGTTIQIADTGINPGAGIGNKRQALNEKNLGCKVVAIGVPTVVNASLIAHQTLEEILNQFEAEPTLSSVYSPENEEILMGIVDKALHPFRESLMVTPKEIDDLIEKSSLIIAGALNMCLHPDINKDNYQSTLN
ncbi:MAG: GPR endopeptidase [Peptococcaceae bacterium]|nr:GPR endopeptidase [Peptococcaceae bacterium]